MNQFRSFLLILLTGILGGGGPVLAKIAITSLPPFGYLTIRMLAAILLLGVFRWNKLKSMLLFKSSLSLVITLSLINIILFSFGIKFTTPNFAQLLYCCSPLIAVIFSRIVLKEAFTTRRLIGVLLGFAGTVLIIGAPLLNGDAIIWFGNILIFICATAHALYLVFSKPLQKTVTPLQITFMMCIATLIISLPFTVFEVSNHQFLFSSVRLESIVAAILMGILSTACYYFVIQWIIKEAGPTPAATVLYIQPFATILISYLWFGETISGLILIAGAAILSGVWLSSSKAGS